MGQDDQRPAKPPHREDSLARVDQSPAAEPPTASQPAAGTLSKAARWGILTAAFLGWMFAGVQMAITPLVSRSATMDLLPTLREGNVGQWFARYNAAFLLGAAAGGLLFGWLGDRAGRAKALGLSILCYSLFSALCYWVTSPEQLLLLRFLSCLGVGGTWPNGIALASETFNDVSRPLMAGIIGTAANVGNVLMGLVGMYVRITPESWRWVMLLGATPAVLGLVVLACVPESPLWMRARGTLAQRKAAAPVAEVFRSPLLRLTLIGILLGTIPLLGGWGSGNWLVPWADSVGALKDPFLKAQTQVLRSGGGAISSLLGGWLAGWLGRRRSYFLISAGSLAMSAYIFHWLTPTAAPFPWCAFFLGVISGFYFGWLPLCLPELFPTRVRSTGAGVTFNFGRVAAAAGVLGGGNLVAYYQGDYAQAGAVTSLIYALGLFVIWFAPLARETKLRD